MSEGASGKGVFQTAQGKYAVLGIGFGLLFPCVATLADAWLGYASLSFSTLLQVQSDNVVHWIVDTAPVVLAVAFGIAGRRHDLYLALNRDLERRVKRRTAALTRAKRQAEQALTVKAEFLAVMSHEIRTPLNGVVGMAQLLCDSGLEGEPKVQARMIQDSAEVLLKLLNDILDMSKMEARGIQLEKVEFDLQLLLSKALDLVAASSGARGLQLALDYRVSATRFVGDAARLRQVVMNLLSNSVKFTAEGGVTLRVLPSAGAHGVRIEVEDTGVGIAQELQRYVFEPFAQADASTSRRFGGTGLGLPISKSLVTAMGGTMGLQSVCPGGSTFWVELELEGSSLARAPATSEALPEAASIRPQLNRRVLLAEDDAINEAVATRMLKKLGVAVDVAHDGREAVTMWRQGSYPVVLMDCRMPKMDGLEAARRIRGLEAPGAHTRIIALTANTTDADREACSKAGMDDFLAKPLKLGELELALKGALADDSIAGNEGENQAR